MHTDLTIYQSNKLTEARYSLSLGEQRIIFFAMAKSSKDMPLQRTHHIKAVEYARMFKISPQDAYEQLQAAADTIYNKSIRIDGKGEDIEQRWMTRKAVYHSGKGAIGFSLAPEILDELENLRKQYTFYELKKIVGMTSPYAIRLFTMLMQFKSTGWFEITVDEFRDRLELKDKYPPYGSLKKWVIMPALDQINIYAGYIVQLKEVKDRRKVVKLRFDFVEDPQARLI